MKGLDCFSIRARRWTGLCVTAATLALAVQAQVSMPHCSALTSVMPAQIQTRTTVRTEDLALHYGWQPVDGINLFYREGGAPDAPTLVLLHGSPTSSIMYQSLMERLAATGKLHVLAVDCPSYGYSDAPDHLQ